MPSSNGNLSSEELGKELSREGRPNRSDFVDIGYTNTDVARTEISGTTEDVTGQPLKEESEEEGENNTSHRNTRGRYHDGSLSPHYQDRSSIHSLSASPKDEEVGSHGEEEDQTSAGYVGDDIRRGLDRESPLSETASVKRKADPSRRSESPERDESGKVCPSCGLSLPSNETMDSHMSVCASSGPPHLTREDDAFHFDTDAKHHNNNNNDNKNDTLPDDLPAGGSDQPNLSHIHQLIRGLSKQPPNGLSGGSPGLNPVLDALKMKLMDSSNQNNENKVESFENMTSLQRAYYTLQQQQMLQVQLIQKIQAQLSLASKEQIPENNNFHYPQPTQHHRDSPISHITNDRRTPSPRNKLPSSNILSELMERFKPTPVQKPNREKNNHRPSVDPRDRPLSPSSTSGSSAPGLQNTVLQHPNPPTNAETNSLEKLQQTANHVLTKASQGIFTHHLIEDSNNSDSRDSSNKHKCRYCGKVFGSDSGLQIHLRSHTGERPFKCNICGNRFTTRGNLKVHFQRHQSRFPHVKMNHNPVPEHLDKLYPPLLAQLGELEDTPPAPTGPPNPFPPPISVPSPSPFNLSSPPPLTLQQPLAASLIYRRVLEKSESEYMNQRFLDIPVSRPDDRINRSLTPPGDSLSKEDSYSAAAAAAEKHANEDQEMSDSLAERQKSLMDKMYSENSMENCNSEGGSDDINMTPKCEMSDAMDDDLSNDSSGSPNSNVGDIQANRELLGLLQRRQLEFPPAAFPGMRLPFNFPFLPGLTNMAHRPGGKPGPPIEIPGGFDVTKDPNIYTNLLPRPGSTDNSWEALIEVQKTSETMKLEQLVNNIENKLTDPNQCIICHRVLSCKSALQMHYRIHTGERPYKCKICSRTFTTKGNLKTHMSVHRARPPIRMLHQCPVCHKRYNNGMILQQHIRQHTGEPTDITNEQMAAAEVRELIPTSMHQMVLPRFPPFSPHIPGLLHLMHPLRPHLFQEAMHRDHEGKDESKEDEKDSRPFSSTLRSFAEEASENRTGSSEDGHSRLSPTRSLSPGPLDFSYSPRTPRNSEERSSRTDDKSPSRGNSPPHRSQGQDHPSSPLDLALRPPPPPLFSPFGLFPPPLTANPLSPQGQQMGLSAKNRFLPAMMNIPGQGNTTCKICFKTLSCASALEIHYRSHTKDRPFLCNVCDRRFTTRGNMKQHMVTHKGHEDNLPPAPPPSEKPIRSRNSTRTHSPKMSVSLPPSSSHMIPSYLQAGISTPSSSASVLQGIPLAPALFTYPQFSHPLAALPGSIAALLGQSGIHGARTEEHKMDLLNLKREREGEIPLPMSKRLSGLGQEGEEKMSTTPPHTPPPAPDTRFPDTHPTHHHLHPSSPTPARTPTSPVPLTNPVNTPHSISELLTHPPSPDDRPCHQPSTSPHTQPLLVS